MSSNIGYWEYRPIQGVFKVISREKAISQAEDYHRSYCKEKGIEWEECNKEECLREFMVVHWAVEVDFPVGEYTESQIKSLYLAAHSVLCTWTRKMP